MNKKQLRKKLALMLANLKKKRPFYTEVEYLESTGTQWIDTGIAGTSDLCVDFMVSTETAPNQACCGFIQQISGGYFRHHYSPDKVNAAYWIQMDASITPSLLVAWEQDKKYHIVIDPTTGNATINDTNYTFTPLTPGIDSGLNYYIFGRQAFNGIIQKCPARFYFFKFVRNGKIIGDFIPVLDWDMTPCMYDKVSGELFYNQGTGDFIAGRQIHPVEYLESTGKQYINTGIIGTNENMGIDVTWAFSNNNASMCIFSSRSAQISNTLTLFWVKDSSNRMRFDGVGQPFFTEGVNASVSDDIFNFNYKSKTDAVATLTNKTTEHIQTLNIGKLETFSKNPLYLFASIDAAEVHSWIKMYGCKIYDGDVIIRDFVPMVDENGLGAMFDRVTHTIYDNAGSSDGFKYPPVELEYLESTGAPYIDTGIQPTDEYGYRIKNTYTRGGGEQCAIGCMNSGNRFVGVYTSGSANQLSGAWGSFVNFLPSYPWDTGDILDVEVNYKNSRKMIVNGTELKDISDIHISGTISNTLYLFARHYDNNITKMNGKIYGVEITNGQDVIAQFIPCYKDGQIGMWDKVNEVFYQNLGTGSFIASKIVEPEYE